MVTVQHLAARGTRFFVPLGIGAHLERWGVPLAQIEEMEWWQKKTLGGVEFVCTPTRHYSGRGLGDRSATLWSSWSVLGPRHRFFYSGDTGYGTHFQEIGSRLGPFDLAFVKIGAYGPGQSWIDIHMPPEDAVQASRDVGAKRMFPVHWSTFNLAYHDWDEPVRRSVAEAQPDQRRAGHAEARRMGRRRSRVRVDAVVGGGALSERRGIRRTDRTLDRRHQVLRRLGPVEEARGRRPARRRRDRTPRSPDRRGCRPPPKSSSGWSPMQMKNSEAAEPGVLRAIDTVPSRWLRPVSRVVS